MFGKSIYLLAFLVAIAVVATAVPKSDIGSYAAKANLSHNLIVGSRVPGDRLVLKQNIVKSSSWMQIVTVQQTFNISRYERITQVKALDQKTNGNGATASLLSGGPGLNQVTLRFKSIRGHGINFVVEVYARP